AVIVVANFGVVSQRVAEGIIEESDEAASTLRTRTLIWQGAVGVIQQHPLIGTGPETFAYAFLPFRAREFNDTVEWNTAYDKAHNEALHLAAGIGLPGTVFWIGLAAVPFIYAVVHARSLWRGRFGGRLRQFRL